MYRKNLPILKSVNYNISYTFSLNYSLFYLCRLYQFLMELNDLAMQDFQPVNQILLNQVWMNIHGSPKNSAEKTTVESL